MDCAIIHDSSHVTSAFILRCHFFVNAVFQCRFYIHASEFLDFCVSGAGVVKGRVVLQ